MIPLRDVIPSRTTPILTITLIVVNVVAFLFESVLSGPELRVLVQVFGVVPADFRWASVFTSMFLHGGWVHMIGNMLYLWI
ncbi:MAG: rhomboid family intramembrane serine protease, partial [Acidobacteria bacterium]|nr:rhomboid family intramembrane serine protease [Acidobacteriota bacterium]